MGADTRRARADRPPSDAPRGGRCGGTCLAIRHDTVQNAAGCRASRARPEAHVHSRGIP